jgi:Cft2 family RNA processing exonuclease
MVGLDDRAFAKFLRRRPDVKIYMSEVTMNLLVNWKDGKFKSLAPSFAVLKTGSQFTLQLGDRTVLVDNFGALHCPGSVMFLFFCQSSGKRVLYTGDFRLEHECHWRSIRALHCPRNNTVLPIDSVHVDTTFCDGKSFFFPSRHESAAALVGAVKKWLTRDPNHVALLAKSANFGHEFLLIELSKALCGVSDFDYG